MRSMILRQLAEEESIEVSEEDVDGAIEQMVEASGGAEDPSVRRTISSQEFRNSMESNLKTRKTLERLALIVQGKEQDDEASGEGVSMTDGEQGGE